MRVVVTEPNPHAPRENARRIVRSTKTLISFLVLVIWPARPLLAQETVLKGRVNDPRQRLHRPDNRNFSPSDIQEVVGVRIPSYASLTLTYRFGRLLAP